jgi:hypothetical protein
LLAGIGAPDGNGKAVSPAAWADALQQRRSAGRSGEACTKSTPGGGPASARESGPLSRAPLSPPEPLLEPFPPLLLLLPAASPQEDASAHSPPASAFA